MKGWYFELAGGFRRLAGVQYLKRLNRRKCVLSGGCLISFYLGTHIIIAHVHLQSEFLVDEHLLEQKILLRLVLAQIYSGVLGIGVALACSDSLGLAGRIQCDPQRRQLAPVVLDSVALIINFCALDEEVRLRFEGCELNLVNKFLLQVLDFVPSQTG